MLYTCVYISGDGTEYKGGTWQKKETPKTITFTCVKPSFYKVNWDKLVIAKDETKNKRHCMREWGDGTYTIYPDQCGTPHIFTPKTEESS